MKITDDTGFCWEKPCRGFYKNQIPQSANKLEELEGRKRKEGRRIEDPLLAHSLPLLGITCK